MMKRSSLSTTSWSTWLWAKHLDFTVTYVQDYQYFDRLKYSTVLRIFRWHFLYKFSVFKETTRIFVIWMNCRSFIAIIRCNKKIIELHKNCTNSCTEKLKISKINISRIFVDKMNSPILTITSNKQFNPSLILNNDCSQLKLIYSETLLENIIQISFSW